MLWKNVISILFCVLFLGTMHPAWAGQNASAGCALDMNIETRDYDPGISSKDIESVITAEAEDEIWVAVVVQNVSNLISYQADVDFDPERMMFIEGYEENPPEGIDNFLKSDGGIFPGPIPPFLSLPGKVSVTNMLLQEDSETAPEGSGIIALLKFEVRDSDPNNILTLSNVMYQDSDRTGDTIVTDNLTNAGVNSQKSDIDEDGTSDSDQADSDSDGTESEHKDTFTSDDDVDDCFIGAASDAPFIKFDGKFSFACMILMFVCAGGMVCFEKKSFKMLGNGGGKMFHKTTCVIIILILVSLLAIMAGCKGTPSSCVIPEEGVSQGGKETVCPDGVDSEPPWYAIPPLPECEEKKDGSGEYYGDIEGLFRHRWWHYYKRALSYMEGGFWKKAESDLREALKQRNEDQWDARTYGMHFIDYFPHRELGIVYYYQAQKEADEADAILKMRSALKQLMVSLEGDRDKEIDGQPSAKALFYLERTYADLVELKPEVIATSEIKVTLNERLINCAISDDPVTISGTVRDENYYIKSIRIKVDGNSDQPVFLLNSENDLKKEVFFSKQIPLSHGPHTIKVEAENIVGKKAFDKAKFPSYKEENFPIQVDKLGPMIAVKDIRHNPLDAKEVTITASIRDEDSDISKFIANSKEVFVQSNNKAEFTVTDPDGPVKLVAYDNAGNQTSTDVPLSLLFPFHIPRLFVQTDSMTDGDNSIPQPVDTEPPLIKIKMENGQELTDKYQIYLKGTSQSLSERKVKIDIEDSSGIESVVIDIEDSSGIKKEAVDTKKDCTSKFCFERLINLQNKITIKATDKRKNITIMTIKPNKYDLAVSSTRDDSVTLPYDFDEHIFPKLIVNNSFGSVKPANNLIRDISQLPMPRYTSNTSNFSDPKRWVAKAKSEDVEVILKLHEAFKLENRLSVLVYPFEQPSKDISVAGINFADSSVGKKFQNSLNNQIKDFQTGSQDKRFNVIEINNCVASDNSDELKKMARDIGAECFIMGNIKKTNIEPSDRNILGNLRYSMCKNGKNTYKKDHFMPELEKAVGKGLAKFYKPYILRYMEEEGSCLMDYSLTLNADSSLTNSIPDNIAIKLIEKRDELKSEEKALEGIIKIIEPSDVEKYKESILKFNFLRGIPKKTAIKLIKKRDELLDLENKEKFLAVVAKIIGQSYTDTYRESILTHTTYSLLFKEKIIDKLLAEEFSTISGVQIIATIHGTEKKEPVGQVNIPKIDSYREDIKREGISGIVKELSDKFSLEFPFLYDGRIILDGSSFAIKFNGNSYHKIKENSILIVYNDTNIVGHMKVMKNKRVLTAKMIGPVNIQPNLVNATTQ